MHLPSYIYSGICNHSKFSPPPWPSRPLSTQTIGLVILLLDGQINPISSNSCSWRETSGLSCSGILYALSCFGLKSGVTLISCIPILHKPGLSENTSGYLSRICRNSCFCCSDKCTSLLASILELGNVSMTLNSLAQGVYQTHHHLH